MAYIQQQSERPLMDHSLLEATTNGNADEVIGLLNAAQPPAPAADPVAIISIPDEGVTSDWDGVLHIAARREYFDIVNAIPERWGAVDVAAKNKRGETALHCAAASGNVRMIVHLISLARSDDKKRQLLRMVKHNGETCLHDAVRSGGMEAVQILVAKDVNVALGSNDGRALVKIQDKQDVSPLYLATTLRKLRVVQFLTTQQGPVGTYPAASYYGPGRKTALHAAVLLDKDLSELLASWNNKELIYKTDESGSTPLHLLASTKDKIIMKLLLDLDPSAGYQADKDGSLPIHIAAADGNREIVKLLSELRPSCSWSSDNLGRTILHIAVRNEEKKVVDYVCSGQKFKQIFNTRDTEGNTALHLAVLQGNQSIFCRLMRRKEIYLSVINKDERTPLDLAVLSIPPAISFSKTPEHWIMYTLIVAGADYGTYRSGHLTRIAGVAKPDPEKESKSIGKSAAVLAVCAVLTLTTAFAQPLAVTKFYDKAENNFARRFAYMIFVSSDALAFALSVVSVSFCSVAGFSFTDKRRQLNYLAAGLTSLFMAAIFILIVFTVGLYLAVGSVVDARIPLVFCVPAVAYPLMFLVFLTPASSVFHHTLALISRLGWSGRSSALICLLPQERHDRVKIRFSSSCVKFMVLVLWGILVLFYYFGSAFLVAKQNRQALTPSPSR